MGSSAGLRGFKAEGSEAGGVRSGWVKNVRREGGDSSRGSRGVGGTARKGSAGEKEVVGCRGGGCLFLAIFPCLSSLLPKKHARASKHNSPEVIDHKIKFVKLHSYHKKKEERYEYLSSQFNNSFHRYLQSYLPEINKASSINELNFNRSRTCQSNVFSTKYGNLHVLTPKIVQSA